MIDSLETQRPRSSGDLWSEICSGLPGHEAGGQAGAEFTDSFEPQPHENLQHPVANGTEDAPSPSAWAPMADSEVYIASLENRLRRIKGQSQEVTSREMLRTLSQARKECWDRFLQDEQISDLFQEGSDFDQSALEQLKRWLQPEKVAISAEELQYLLLPEEPRETAGTEEGLRGAEAEEQDEDEENQAPEKKAVA
uniref:Coiled-coil domain containing 32 n=2 Tax=Lepisosteus oculatus TaxID=7918 RepID=W5NC02_LEPOC